MVMNNYQHFSTSGNVAGGNTDEHDVVGETHGGNTAEERLVSVIVVKRKQPLAQICARSILFLKFRTFIFQRSRTTIFQKIRTFKFHTFG